MPFIYTAYITSNRLTTLVAIFLVTLADITEWITIKATLVSWADNVFVVTLIEAVVYGH